MLLSLPILFSSPRGFVTSYSDYVDCWGGRVKSLDCWWMGFLSSLYAQ